MSEVHVCTRSEELAALRERVAVSEQSNKACHYRMDGIQEQTAAIVKLSSSVEYMAHRVEDMLQELRDQSQTIKTQDERLTALEKAPGDTAVGYWDTFVKSLIGLIAAAIFGYFIATGGKQ